MAANPIAQRYAEAAFEAAEAAGATDDVRAHLTALAEAVRRHDDIAGWLANPGVTSADKLQALVRAADGQWPWVLEALLATMLKLGRATYLADVAEAFAALVDRARGRVRAVVRSARPLSSAATSRLQRALERWQGKQVELAAETAPELLGGLEIRLEHLVINGSVKAELEALRERLGSARVS